MNFRDKEFDLGRIDFLLARRKYTLDMLNRAGDQPVLDGRFTVKTVRPDDLIGLKVQSSSNDRGRYYQDMADIRSILANERGKLDMDHVREYFRMFGREKELEGLLKGVENAE